MFSTNYIHDSMVHLRCWRGLERWHTNCDYQQAPRSIQSFMSSCLKKKMGLQVIPIAALHEQVSDYSHIKVPREVLHRRMYKKGEAAGVGVCGCWCTGRGLLQMTLHGRITMTSLPSFQILSFNLEDKVVFQARG